MIGVHLRHLKGHCLIWLKNKILRDFTRLHQMVFFLLGCTKMFFIYFFTRLHQMFFSKFYFLTWLHQFFFFFFTTLCLGVALPFYSRPVHTLKPYPCSHRITCQSRNFTQRMLKAPPLISRTYISRASIINLTEGQ